MLFLHQIFSSFWAITDTQAVNYMPLIASYMKGNRVEALPERPNHFALASIENAAYQIQTYGRNIPENIPANSIGVIDIRGAMTKYDQDCGPDGMLTISNLLKRCYANEGIKAIVLRIDSGGGETVAWRMMNDAISVRNKPVVAFVEDCACSAAYGIASGCDMIVANHKMAITGCIGSLSTIFDYREYLKKEGITEITVYATPSKDKNKWFRNALDGDTALLQKMTDESCEDFISTIEKNRGDKLKSDRSEWGTGKEYYSDQSIKIGLIDGIDTFENVLNYFNT